MKMKTSELIGNALIWAVAECEGIELINGCHNRLIEREGISVWVFDDVTWKAEVPLVGVDCVYEGSTPLIAAMRCYVASKLGDEVDVPDELMKGETI